MISITVSPGFGSISLPRQTWRKCSRTPASLHRAVVRQEHRDQPRVRGPLHVVLPAQRMQPGARPPDVPAEQRERDQAARVVGAVDVLADPHAPEDHRRPRPREAPRHRADRLGVDAAERRHLLRREARDMRAERLEPLGEAVEVLPVVEPLLHDHVHDRVEQRHVRPRPELQHPAWRAASAPCRAGP